MNRHQNQRTQPFHQHPVFDNWEVVAEGWYVAVASHELRKKPVSVELCGQRITLWRGRDGRARAVDAYCPHMGADLGIGKVDGDHLRCFFHHWAFDGSGACVDVPAGGDPPKAACLQGYATEERYGFVWVWPAAEAAGPLPEFPALEGHETRAVAAPAYERSCHHHVCMINGIDPQHLKTVHNLGIEMQLDVRERAARIRDYSLIGEMPSTHLKERLARLVFGGRYGYSMRYADGTLGLLTLMEHTRLFGKGPTLPSVHMLFAYVPLGPGRIRVQPVYVTRKRRGPLGWLLGTGLLWTMRWGFSMLRDEDGKVYDNIRFQTRALLPMDKPIAHFVACVNPLQPSVWSAADRAER